MYAKQDSPESNKQGVELDELYVVVFKPVKLGSVQKTC